MEAASIQAWSRIVSDHLVLVIEDDEPVREVVSSCLEDIAGWQVIAAGSGAEGLQLAQQAAPDGIILDLMMPEMDGFTFLQQLQSLAQTTEFSKPPFAIVLLTAKVDLIQSNDLADQLAELGVRGAIAKPFDPLTLTGQVAELMGWT
jgi:CheY-like chemotaxis protein